HQLRGHGLAAELMKRAMDDARAEGVQVLPVCSYAVAFLRGTDAYDDVVAG
ncbi:MAG: N-acetyltransferase, partial [Acidimicrobiales bacterium]|nr:N-acetyltransferase [Acidimicrobiales bacterium]